MKEEENKENEEITLQCSLPLPMQQSCTGGQANFFLSLNEEEKQEENEEKVEEEENKQEEEDKIRTAMPSSVAMQEGCTRGPREIVSFQCTRRGRKKRRWRKRKRKKTGKEAGGGGTGGEGGGGEKGEGRQGREDSQLQCNPAAMQ